MMNYWNNGQNWPAASGMPARGWGIHGYYPYAGGSLGNGYFIFGGILHIIIAVLVIVLLITLIRYVWKKGGK